VIVYPAIDLKGGRCVRLMQGDMGRATVYGNDPVAIARSFEEKGAEWLHVVDLDGAFAGNSVNIEAIAGIVKSAHIPVQLGGGIRSMEQLDNIFNKIGISRAILGTAALEDQEFLRQAVKLYGSRIAAGIDAREGRVAVRGWAEVSDTTALDLARKVKDIGVMTIIYTDISRDGMLSGPNTAAAEELIRATGLGLIVSGGVAELAHITKCREIGAAGVIIGKALYTGAIKIEDAVAEGRKTC
jgi:phosphoribosylformimino-5-aminoimidazole carboxamide ribotide isomerase